MAVGEIDGEYQRIVEYGEIGRLVKKIESEGAEDMVVLWAVVEVRGNLYCTSKGWIEGKPEEFFAPRPKERSLRPAIIRALNYAEEKYPGLRSGTH